MKTTVLGVITIIAAVANAVVSFSKTGSIDFGILLPAITGGLGLIKAADQK